MVTKKKIRIPIFEYDITVLVFDKWSDLDGYIPKELSKDSCRGLTIEYDWKCIVCITPKHLSTLSHEAFHIVNLIWKSIGYEPQRDNDEVSAYLLTYVVEQLTKVLNKHLTQNR